MTTPATSEPDDVLELPLLDGRAIRPDVLMRGRTLTHRVTAAEIAGDWLAVSPDLEPASVLTELDSHAGLVGGGEVLEAQPGLDDDLLEERGLTEVEDAVWLLPPGALSALRPAEGDLVAVHVRPDGFELERLDDVPDGTALAQRLADLIDQHAEGEPVPISTLLWQAVATDADVLRRPAPPVVELLAAAGLSWRGEEVAPAGFDFDRWQLTREIDDVREAYELEPGEALAVVLLADLHHQLEEDPALDAATHPAAAVGPQTLTELLGALSESVVADALVMEVLGFDNRGARLLADLAAALEPQAPRSARANLRWIRGRALDLLGEAQAAEEAFTAAVDLDARGYLPLFDLARIASDRGDAPRALSLLQRAELPQDDPMVLTVQRFLPVERTDLGRNDPCWCGSGRKHKACHLGRAELPLLERAAWLHEKAVAFVGLSTWHAFHTDLLDLRPAHPALVMDALLAEEGAFAEFLTTRGALLPDDERALAEAWLAVTRSVYAVEEATASGFTARDLATGERHLVHAPEAAVAEGDVVAARLLPVGDALVVPGGAEPVAPEVAEGVLARLRTDGLTAVDVIALLSPGDDLGEDLDDGLDEVE